ncbi:hypothetical protein [Mycobacterium sp. OTB74]|jgi:hypothetical protein|uniref:hypothetical protein n=1 Tax=Mycobacterium sp. OTB74 TaxID=1853452 RepID=UPI0024744BE0|nr:hypothetical protein [Mycobacterium sp. OTB74]MDH6243329.1 hypothetical protein [Mycobacterium sp. OTB74]
MVAGVHPQRASNVYRHRGNAQVRQGAFLTEHLFCVVAAETYWRVIIFDVPTDDSPIRLTLRAESRNRVRPNVFGQLVGGVPA